MKSERTKYVKEFHFNTLEDLLNAISPNGSLYHLIGTKFAFRGHSTEEYKLTPSILRGNQLDYIYPFLDFTKENYISMEFSSMEFNAEYYILKKFFNLCDVNGLYVPECDQLRAGTVENNDFDRLGDKEEWLPKDLEELAGLAQHYGISTRLLDWTYDIYVAMYFASMGAIKNLYEPKKLTEAEWLQKNQREVKGIRNIRKTKDSEQPKNMEFWVIDTQFQNYQLAYKAPLRFTRPRYEGNPNLCAQKGLFSFWSETRNGIIEEYQNPKLKRELVNRAPLDELLTEHIDSWLENGKYKEAPECLYRITIPQSEALLMYQYIRRIGYDAAKLFPGYWGIVNCMKENNLVEWVIKKALN